MEKIKYRIYDPQLQKMFESGSTPTMLSSFFKATAVLNTLRGMDYLEYTGVNDRNGKQIFEGDVLKCNLWKDSLNGTAIVKHDPPGFYLDYSHNADNFPEDFADKFWKFDIIGNIYESPDLLKK